mmetsp:Transcript_63242/g.193458  ORF Transcript_63242/g.193458 Transcript_63242/m.193458 type:complete len:288 (+) Transcript_63242:2225-3088(+)
MSGSRSSMRSEPMAISTSDNPCAAPLRSTADSTEQSVWNIHGMTSGSMSSGKCLAKVPKAFAAVARTSGIGSTSVSFNCGTSSGMYGWMSFGSLISSTMEPTICAPLRFISAERSFNARCTNGQTRESDGASMWCTNDVPKSWSRTSFVMCSYCAPSVSAEISSGAMAFNSGLVMMLPILSKASRAASFTLACWSLITVHKAGTTWGRHAASCFGKQFVMVARISTLPNFVRHCLSLMPSMSGFNTCFTPGPLSCDIIAREALWDAACTSRFGSANACNNNGNALTT